MTQADVIYTLIKDVFLLLDDTDRQFLNAFELTGPRFDALYHLGASPGISVSELSNLMFCDKSNITRLIRSMEDEELVRRTPHESDGRTLRLFLTPAGEALREEVLRAHSCRNEQRFASCLGASEQERLYSYLLTLKHWLMVDLGQLEAS